MNGTHVEVKSLAPSLQAALKGVSYGARDIEVIPGSEVELYAGAGSKGARGFLIALNLETGERKTLTGDWGGAGLGFRPIDFTHERYTLPEHGCVIKGSTGWPRTFARIYVHPSQLARYLPAVDEATTDEEQQALYCHYAIKGGQYRREELRRRKVSTTTVDSLVERGYLTRNKAGAVSITLKGKNAADRTRVRY